MMPRHRLCRCALALAFVLGTVARADEPPLGSIVSTVQPPAWLLHGNVLMPLPPGISIADGDTLRTGSGGRVYLALPEQSTVKLGENTDFATPDMAMPHEGQGKLFKGVLQILKGVFRFTTSLAGKSEHRDVQIHVATATIGIRGTDVWGRAGKDGALVALLEGKISMDMPGQSGMKMEQPMHYMTMSAAGSMQKDIAVSAANVADWAAQTDVTPGTGVLKQGGHWEIALLSSPNDDDVLQQMKKLDAAGYPAEDIATTYKGQPWHRLVIRHVASYKDGQALVDKIRILSSHVNPWIHKSPAIPA